jgi:adiponectin receptor
MPTTTRASSRRRLRSRSPAVSTPSRPKRSGSRASRSLGHDPSRGWYTLTWEEAPHYLKHNSFIKTGYRYQSTAWQCIKSLAHLHNQTTNIYSHLLAALGFLLLLLRLNTVIGISVGVEHWVWLGAEVTAQVVLFTFSAVFHLFDAHSHGTYMALVKCDYAGILVAFSASLAVFSRYAFACNRDLQAGYTWFFSGIIIPVCLIVLSPRLATPQYRGLRATTFALTIGTGIIAVIHFATSQVLQPHAGPKLAEALWYCVASYTTQAAVVVVYVSRVPERWIRGPVMDIWCHSHTIVHLLCLLSSWLWFQAIVLVFNYRKHQEPNCMQW